MRRVLVVYFSQTGQLGEAVDSFTRPLRDDPSIEVVFERLEPRVDYPFPWPFMRFFSIFPESVYMDPPPMKPLSVRPDEAFDLVILAYQVWFLSPSLPVTGFLKSEAAQRLLRGKPVVTLIACRDMWLMAQEKVKRELRRLDAELIDNVALVDESGSAMSFLSTPLWMFTGRKGPWPGVPRAGVARREIDDCRRFGARIAAELRRDAPRLDAPLLTGLGAVSIKEKIIASERMAHRSFLLWGRLLRAVGGPDSRARRGVMVFYISFLIMLILTVVPLAALLKKLLAPLSKGRVQKQKQYYAAPSGESRHLMERYTHE